MVARVRFTAQQPKVVVRRRPIIDANPLSLLEEGDEIEAADVFIDEGVEWVKLARGSFALRGNKEVGLDLREDGYVPTEDPTLGALLRKHHAQVAVQEIIEEGALSKAEIQEILDRSMNPDILLPLESKFWTKSQFEVFVMSGGLLRPRGCSVQDERLHMNMSMSEDDVGKALSEAAAWLANADALLIGSGAGMGVDSGLGTFRGGHRGVWPGLDKVGLAYEEICNPKWFKEEPHLAWAFWNFCHEAYKSTTPHAGYALPRGWGRRCPYGYFSFTSNIDSHWITSGCSADNVMEVHGAVRWLQCSEGCCPDVWRVPKEGHNLVEDSETARVRGILPICPKCKAVARPNVQMFGGDSFFSKARRSAQLKKYEAWLKKLESQPDKDKLQIVCLELGCGLTVPTVRKELEAIANRFPSARFIRVNPENPGLAPELAKRGVSLPLKAAHALEELGKQIDAIQQDMVTFMISDESGGGCELQASSSSSLRNVLRRAEVEHGLVNIPNAQVSAHAWLPMSSEAVDLSKPYPLHRLNQIKDAEGPNLQIVAVLHVNGMHFPAGRTENIRHRAEQVMRFIDDLIDAFDESFREKANGCKTKSDHLKLVTSVQSKVWPKYEIENTEKASWIMMSWIGCLRGEDVLSKVQRSMEASMMYKMATLPTVIAKKAAPKPAAGHVQAAQKYMAETAPPPNQRHQQQQQQQHQQQLHHQQQGVQQQPVRVVDKVGAAHLPPSLRIPSISSNVVPAPASATTSAPKREVPIEPLTVTLTKMGTQDDPEPQKFTLNCTTATQVGDLKRQIAERYSLEEKAARQIKLIMLSAGGFMTAKDTSRVKADVFVHGLEPWPAPGSRHK